MSLSILKISIVFSHNLIYEDVKMGGGGCQWKVLVLVTLKKIKGFETYFDIN